MGRQLTLAAFHPAPLSIGESWRPTSFMASSFDFPLMAFHASHFAFASKLRKPPGLEVFTSPTVACLKRAAPKRHNGCSRMVVIRRPHRTYRVVVAERFELIHRLTVALELVLIGDCFRRLKRPHELSGFIELGLRRANVGCEQLCVTRQLQLARIDFARSRVD